MALLSQLSSFFFINNHHSKRITIGFLSFSLYFHYLFVTLPQNCVLSYTKMKNNNNERKELPIWLALLPLLLLMAMLVFTIRAFGSNSLSGPSQIVMLAASAVCCIIGITAGRVRWHEFESQIAKNISHVSSALIILLFIGALGGAWMVSGVVPMMIYYGLDIIHPSVFLASTCAISAAVSVMTGSCLLYTSPSPRD